jgi:hypothetical protein
MSQTGVIGIRTWWLLVWTCSPTNIGGGYVYGSGTSLATPHVSGVGRYYQALRLSAGMGKLAPWDVESLLKSTAVDLGSPGYDEASGYGLVDAYNATLRALDAVVVTVTTTCNHDTDCHRDTCLHYHQGLDHYPGLLQPRLQLLRPLQPRH